MLLGDRIGQATSRACVPRDGCTILACTPCLHSLPALRGRSTDQVIDPTHRPLENRIVPFSSHGKVN